MRTLLGKFDGYSVWCIRRVIDKGARQADESLFIARAHGSNLDADIA